MVADVCRAATRLLLTRCQDAQAAPHLVAYIDLLARALERFRRRDANAAAMTLGMLDFRPVLRVLQSLLADHRISEPLVLERLSALAVAANESREMKE